MAHFLGPGGARKFLSNDPNLPAYDIMGNQAEANAPIFLDRGRPRTFGEIYSLLNKRIQKKLNETGGVTVASASDKDKAADTSGGSGAAASSTPAKGSTAPDGGKKLADAATAYAKPSAVAPTDTPVAQAPAPKKSMAPGAQSVVSAPADTSVAGVAQTPTPAVASEDRLPTSRQTPPANPMRDFVRTPTASPSEAGAQASIVAQGLSRTLDGVSNILVQQLTVQRNSESLLRQLLNAVSRNGSMVATAAGKDDEDDGAPGTVAAPTRADRQMPAAPVSMRKANYA